jgi:hypothetical protein
MTTARMTMRGIRTDLFLSLFIGFSFLGVVRARKTEN